MKAPRSAGANALQGRPLSPPTHDYLTVPYRLITDLHDNQLALGLYSLVARLYLVEQRPIPLSTGDVQRYDPGLSRGAILRAFARLVRGGWLLETVRAGHKACYTPCWGLVGGAPRSWVMDAPSLGRPRHVHALRLERRLLDTYMGRLTTHPTRGALVERYMTQPILGLSDVGAYLLALHGQPVMTPQLARYALVIRGQALPLPSDEAILAQASQRSLEDAEEIAITEKGLRKLGCRTAPHPSEDRQTLFFVPPAMIGTVIAPMIGSTEQRRGRLKAIAKARLEEISLRRRILRNQFKSEESSPLPPRPTTQTGGGKKTKNQKVAIEKTPGLPSTPSAQLLRAINVRPSVVAELSSLPSELVQAAIDDGRSRQGIVDLAGWVVSMLRDARDHSWEIARGSRGGEQEMRERIERAKASGLFRSDDDLDPVVAAGCDSGSDMAPLRLELAYGAAEPEAVPGSDAVAGVAGAVCSGPQGGDRGIDHKPAKRSRMEALLSGAFGAEGSRSRSGDALPAAGPLGVRQDLGGLDPEAVARFGAVGAPALFSGPLQPGGPHKEGPDLAPSLSPVPYPLFPGFDDLRQALRARTRPDVHRVIAELDLRWGERCLLVYCRDAAALGAVQHQLLPLIRPLLVTMGVEVPRIAVLLRPQRR